MSAVLITRAEASRRTALSLVTIDKLIRAGTLPAVRLGRRVGIPEHAVSDYINHAARPSTRRRAAEVTETRIRELVESAPPLTDEQRSRLRALLAPVGADTRRGAL